MGYLVPPLNIGNPKKGDFGKRGEILLTMFNNVGFGTVLVYCGRSLFD